MSYTYTIQCASCSNCYPLTVNLREYLEICDYNRQHPQTCPKCNSKDLEISFLDVLGAEAQAIEDLDEN